MGQVPRIDGEPGHGANVARVSMLSLTGKRARWSVIAVMVKVVVPISYSADEVAVIAAAIVIVGVQWVIATVVRRNIDPRIDVSVSIGASVVIAKVIVRVSRTDKQIGEERRTNVDSESRRIAVGAMTKMMTVKMDWRVNDAAADR